MTKRQQFWALTIGLPIIVFLILALAQTGATVSSCGWKFPMWFGCVLAKHENLAGGLVATAGALFAGWLAWTSLQTQIRMEREAQARRDREYEQRQLLILRAACDYFRPRYDELHALKVAKRDGREQMPWWAIYMGMFDRGLLDVDPRLSVEPSSNPAFELDRAANSLRLRMERFADIYRRRVPNPDRQRVFDYQNSAWGGAEVQQLEHDMEALVPVFFRAFETCEKARDSELTA